MFNPFHSKNRPSNTSRRLRQKLNLISLESRDVPSVVPIVPIFDSGRLMIEGTKFDDMIQVRIDPNEFIGVVEANGSIAAKFDVGTVRSIEIHGDEGNDRIFIGTGISVPTLLDGGEGNDWLFASEGHVRQFTLGMKPGRPSTSAILIGGAGDDVLFGTNDRDMLIGGDGRDVLMGNGAEDILIAGRSIVDGDSKVLFSLMASWNSTDAYVDRVANIRLEMKSAIPTNRDMSFVFHDGSADELYGGDGRDWFFAGNDIKPIDWTMGEEVE